MSTFMYTFDQLMNLKNIMQNEINITTNVIMAMVELVSINMFFLK